MSRHEGVSCDSCLKGNFRGRRYKCLICYDYDLCETCYEGGATSTRHTTDHPMQCILTRTDFDLFYGGEALANIDQPQSYTCPYCSRMGFTDITLQEHVSNEHTDTSFEVVCPLCAAMPGGDPNLMTDDFAGHLNLEHRTGPRDLISFLDEPASSRHSAVRRIPHSTHLGAGSRGGQSSRPRRSNMHFSVFSSGGLSSLSPSSREAVDPIAELLSQLSGVRRSTSSSNSAPSQLQQLQMQLQLERQQVNAARQQLERLPRRQNQSQTTLREANTSSPGYSLLINTNSNTSHQPSNLATSSPSQNSSYLLDGLFEEATQKSTIIDPDNLRGRFLETLTYCTALCEGLTLNLPEESPISDESSGIIDEIGAVCDGPEVPTVDTGTVTNTASQIMSGSSTKLVETTVRSAGNSRLRGRARSDGYNSVRRAEANKASMDTKNGDKQKVDISRWSNS